MNNRVILERIINEGGSCTWSSRHVCVLCPMSRLKKHESGAYMSCIEAVGAHEMSEEEADKRYREVAIALLMDVEVDSILEGKKDSDGQE